MDRKNIRIKENQGFKSGEVSGNVIKDVAVLGPFSKNKNGRHYTEEFHRSAVNFYEGISVAPDHSEKRSVLESIGKLEGIYLKEKEDGFHTFAKKLIINPHHSHAKQILWAAENNIKNLGLSHDILAESSVNKKTGIMEVKKCISAFEVSLVQNPAANKNLFESLNPSPPEKRSGNLKMEIDEVKYRKEMEELKILRKEKEKIESMKEARNLCEDKKMDEKLISEIFIQAISEIKDLKLKKSLIEDRKNIFLEEKNKNPEITSKNKQLIEDSSPEKRLGFDKFKDLTELKLELFGDFN